MAVIVSPANPRYRQDGALLPGDRSWRKTPLPAVPANFARPLIASERTLSPRIGKSSSLFVKLSASRFEIQTPAPSVPAVKVASPFFTSASALRDGPSFLE